MSYNLCAACVPLVQPAAHKLNSMAHMFTGTSGTLGEFRAGTVAALFGAFTSVLVGGLGAIAVALIWMRLFPEITKIDAIRDRPF